MVYCCVPQCGTDSWRCDPAITFHDFPANPDLAAKWIRQVNTAVKSQQMWFPRGKAVICSKHFLSTDYKDDSDVLKHRVVPTVFGHKYIGQNSDESEDTPFQSDDITGPLIVKIKTEPGEQQTDDTVQISNRQLEAIINEPEKCVPYNNITLSRTSGKYYPRNSKMGVKYQKSHNSLKASIPGIPNKTLGALTALAQKGRLAVKRIVQKRDNNDSNLIEIGPNTFLKINPDIIKVNKKQTPSGNTVLQFLMDQKLASTIGADMLPKIVQGAAATVNEATTNIMKSKSTLSSTNAESSNLASKNTESVQHVLGHLVDTHVCKESCAKLHEIDNILMDTDDREHENINPNMTNSGTNQPDRPNLFFNQTQANCDSLSTLPATSSNASFLFSPSNANQSSKTPTLNDKADSHCIEKAPVLLTTNMSLAHCFMEKTKYLSHLRQKARQTASLKQKVSMLNKKIEDLENKCIVQERQLSFSFLKRLRTIRKNATKGDPAATYIMEQIRAYSGQKQMRWSDTTLNQCAIWCRKAPYAYEYFKKAEFFKLPCLGTVKRFIRKHPEMTFTNKSVINPKVGEEDSSSDFDFDEEESLDGQDREMNDEHGESIMCETILSEETSNSGQQHSYRTNIIVDHNGEASIVEDNSTEATLQHEIKSENHAAQNMEVEKHSEASSYPVSVDGTNLEIQELILPSGEVVQCYSSSLCNDAESGNQYYIIPNAGDQNSSIDHEYSIIQSADSVPVILQNLENSQLHQEQQLIFITNSADQVECTETEVVTAR